MWLTSSSVGRKLVMAITGACLVLFVTFHALMNGVALFWPSAYNAVCAFLGANWYALIASVGLAALFIIHIIYAVWLTIQNRKARGNDRYAVYRKPKQVEWSSQNMLVLGIVIIAFLVIHLIQFWAKMQWAEICHDPVHVDGQLIAPQSGTLFLQLAFSQVYTPIVYIIGFIALWFHMTHGFWSMFQSAGWDNDTWLPRLKTISCWWTTIVVGLFIAQAIVFTVQAHRGAYLTDPQLIEQYQEFNAHMGAGFEQPSYPGVDCSGKACNQPCDNQCAPQAQCDNCGNECTGNCGDDCTGDCATCNSAQQCQNDPAACGNEGCDQSCVEVVEVQ